jgi:hypothetical protein
MPSAVGRVLLGLLPLWILLIRLIADPWSLFPVRYNPSAVAGLPTGILLVGQPWQSWLSASWPCAGRRQLDRRGSPSSG